MNAWWIHNLTHSHVYATKPGIGEVTLCRRKWSMRMEAQVLPDDGNGAVIIPAVTTDEVADVVSAASPSAMRVRAQQILKARAA